jgi:hypothetical protein
MFLVVYLGFGGTQLKIETNPAFRALQAQDQTQLCFLEYCFVIAPAAMTITPTAIMIYPFTVHSGLLYMNDVEGPREDLL